MLLCANFQKASGDREFPCGMCTNCRINKQRKWVARMILEARSHHHSLFVTFTYNDEHIPRTAKQRPTLCKKDIQDFMKRLRRAVPDHKVRYFITGEYGPQTYRPHYHAVLFGFPLERCEEVLQKAWGKGFVAVSIANRDRIAYVAQYCLKKRESKEDVEIRAENGRDEEPEFQQMSRNPGLGRVALEEIVEAYQAAGGQIAIERNGDVSRLIRQDGRKWPLDRYALDYIRDELDLPPLAADRPAYRPEDISEEEREQAKKAHEKHRRAWMRMNWEKTL